MDGWLCTDEVGEILIWGRSLLVQKIGSLCVWGAGWVIVKVLHVKVYDPQGD